MKKIIYILFMLTYAANGQSYLGFMGKRNIVHVNFCFGLSSQSQNNKAPLLGITYPVKKIETEIDRSINSKTTIGASFRYMHSFFNSATYHLGTLDFNSVSSLVGTASINQFTLGGFFKIFLPKRGGFAPQGKYVQFGLNYHLLNIVDYHFYDLDPPQSGSSSTNAAAPIDSININGYTSLYFGFGNHKIIKVGKNHISINMAIGTNISDMNIPSLFSSINNSNSLVGLIDPKPKLVFYLSGLDFVSAKIGVGYLF